MARPSEYNIEMCKEICCQVANGKNIKTVLKSNEEYPSFVTWCEWKREHDELANLYTRSIQDKAESEDEEIDTIIQDLKEGNIDPASARLIIDTKKWKASKYYPKMFGEKVDVTSDNKAIKVDPINIVIDGNSISLK